MSLRVRVLENIDTKTVVMLSTTVACVSFTISETAIFFGLREWLKRKNRFIGKLVSCGYCLSHWIAFDLIIRFARELSYFDLILLWLVVTWLAGFHWVVMCFLMKLADK